LEKERKGTITIEGKVVSGVGEGAHYVCLTGYREQFKARLGFDPYPGTLNLRLSRSSLHRRRRLDSLSSIAIKGFTKDGAKCGDVKCFKVLVQGRVKGAAIIIDRTHYTSSTLEVIAPLRLREELGLRDGDMVRLEVFVEENETDSRLQRSQENSPRKRWDNLS